MPGEASQPTGGRHDHVFLGADHARNERNLWAVIALCTAMMIAEIVGGAMFGSIALIADGFHMSTHAGALLLAGLAYRYARRYADDPRLTFGSGKFGDLAGFASAILLAAIAAAVGYEAIARLFAPRPIAFAQAIPIAALGLVVNVASAWLLMRGGRDHAHGHSHGHDHGNDEDRVVELGGARLRLEIFEDGVATALSSSSAERQGLRRSDFDRNPPPRRIADAISLRRSRSLPRVDRRDRRAPPIPGDGRRRGEARAQRFSRTRRRSRSPRGQSRQRDAGGGHSRDGRRGGVDRRHRRPRPRAPLRLAVDGPGGGADRRGGDR